jgi:hypothetical protein
MSDNLGEFFAEARRYGLVDLFTLDGGTYSCRILVALEDREIKAKSGFGHMTPNSAIKAAMQVAAGILMAATTENRMNRGAERVLASVV